MGTTVQLTFRHVHTIYDCTGTQYGFDLNIVNPSYLHSRIYPEICKQQQLVKDRALPCWECWIRQTIDIGGS